MRPSRNGLTEEAVSPLLWQARTTALCGERDDGKVGHNRKEHLCGIVVVHRVLVHCSAVETYQIGIMQYYGKANLRVPRVSA